MLLFDLLFKYNECNCLPRSANMVGIYNWISNWWSSLF
jgi:hypothetical protein